MLLPNTTKTSDLLLFFPTLVFCCFLRNKIKKCFSFVFTLQGPPGLPGPKVIKCMLCYPGPCVKLGRFETAELH